MKDTLEKYDALCIEDDCYKNVREDDVERDFTGKIYERSKKCWDCRTPQDRRAIKAWRKKQKKWLPKPSTTP